MTNEDIDTLMRSFAAVAVLEERQRIFAILQAAMSEAHDPRTRIALSGIMRQVMT